MGGQLRNYDSTLDGDCADSARRRRRRFAAEDKIRINKEAEGCRSRGELKALLCREGITHSHLANWRRQIRRMGLVGLLEQRPGPKANPDERDELILKQQRAIELLERELSIANALVDLQKKAKAVLGKAQSATAEMF